MKNILFIFAAPLGDSIIYSSFLTSYHQQFPEHQIYYTNKWPGGVDQLIGPHPFIITFDKNIHSNIQFGQIYEMFVIDFAKYNITFEPKTELMHYCIYKYFKLKYNIDLPIVENIPNIGINNKIIKKYDKPVCLLNHCVSYGRI